jgi:geranylgeranyl reductase family protein
VSFDVIIAGAGPAGVATAVALVRREGLNPKRLVVLDRARFPRPKPCGGGLTGHALGAMAAVGLELRVPSVPAIEGEVVYGSLRRTVAMGKPVHIVRRDDFDADLVAQARELGIEVREGEGVASHVVDRQESRVAVKTSGGGTLSARVLVAADGVGSGIRKQLLAGHAHAGRQPLRLARLELPAPTSLPPRMIYDFTPFAEGLRGYVWLFPVPGGRVNVGVMHYPASDLGGRALDRILADCLARHGVTLPGPARGWPAWTYDGRSPIAAPHVLCVGDSAGIDALTGEGIAVGLESGPLAANAITRALASGDFRFTGYRRALRRAVVGRELALDGRLARLLYGSRHWQSWLGLVFFDPRMLALYAARVSGSEILADRKLALVGTLLRHLAFGRGRAQALARATVAMAGTEASSAAPASVDVGRDQRHVG